MPESKNVTKVTDSILEGKDIRAAISSAAVSVVERNSVAVSSKWTASGFEKAIIKAANSFDADITGSAVVKTTSDFAYDSVASSTFIFWGDKMKEFDAGAMVKFLAPKFNLKIYTKAPRPADFEPFHILPISRTEMPRALTKKLPAGATSYGGFKLFLPGYAQDSRKQASVEMKDILELITDQLKAKSSPLSRILIKPLVKSFRDPELTISLESSNGEWFTHNAVTFDIRITASQSNFKDISELQAPAKYGRAVEADLENWSKNLGLTGVRAGAGLPDEDFDGSSVLVRLFIRDVTRPDTV